MANRWSPYGPLAVSVLAASMQAAVLAVPAAAAPPAPVSGPPPAVNAPARSDAVVDAALQRDLHLSADQIRTRRAREATAPDVERTLRTMLGQRFGGAWLSSDGVLTVGITGGGADGAAVRAAGATPLPVAYSQEQLTTVKAALDSRATAAPGEVYGWHVDLLANRVIITAAPGRESAARAFAVYAGVPAGAVRVVAGTQRPHTMSVDLPGGDEFWVSFAEPRSRCSVGFAVSGGFITAGHCNTSSFLAGPNFLYKLGSWGGSEFPGHDYGWIRTNELYAPIAQAKGIGNVAGSREAVVGTAVCRSGWATGVRCGYILDKDETIVDVSGPVKGLTRTSACAAPGDSGGPFMADDQAQGVLSVGAGPCGYDGSYTLFQPINPILSAYGLTLTTTPTASLWWNQSPGNSERGTVHTDVNGDHRDDVVVFQRNPMFETKVWVFLGNSYGGFGPPTMAWDSGLGAWDLNRSRFVSGDFNRDGRGDIAAFYDYGSDHVKLWVFLANGNGGFDAPTMQWDSGPGQWDINNVRLLAGDFDGDGYVDVVAVYHYAAQPESMFVFHANGMGGLTYLMDRWFKDVYPPEGWDLSHARLVAGDFNGDGLTDIAALYDYGNNWTKLVLFHTYPGIAWQHPIVKWDSGAGNWDLTRSRLVTGDFNGDGRSDIAVFYSYVNDDTKLWVFYANASGGFNAPTVMWDSGDRSWNLDNTRLMAGDFNGDGHVDIGAFYRYANNQTKLWTLLGNGLGRFDPAYVRWDSGPGNWSYDNAAPV